MSKITSSNKTKIFRTERNKQMKLDDKVVGGVILGSKKSARKLPTHQKLKIPYQIAATY
ncbi:hypothetical protein JNK13_04160 [bacterium]|nr:hypothetical protein [bacterium]